MTTESTYPLFVYGSLRPGQPLWKWLQEAVVGHAVPAYVRGFRLCHSAAGNYPVMTPVLPAHRPGQKLVRGTLVHVRNTPAFQAIWNMEIRAGYEAETVNVYTGPDPQHLTLREEAFAFTWDTIKYDYGMLCQPIVLDQPTGLILYDWAAEVLRERRAMPGLDEVQSIPSQKTLANHT